MSYHFALRGRAHPASIGCGQRHPVRLRVESLEDRTAPSIVFANRGQPSDTFTPAEHALIDRAIQLWDERLARPPTVQVGNQVLPIPQTLNVTFLGGSNSDVELYGALGMGGAGYSTFLGVPGFPDEGTVQIASSASLARSGFSWYIDPNPWDNAEFSAVAPSYFQAGPGDADMLTTLCHELGHVLGFASFYPQMSAHISASPGSTTALFTGSNGFQAVLEGGPTTEGGDFAHLSALYHPGDVMTAVQMDGERELPSAMDVRILTDAFGYQSPTAQATVTTFLKAEPNPTTIGQPVTFTVWVSANWAMPTGLVQLLDGGAPLGTAQPLVNGQAAISVTLASVGVHHVTAKYTPDSPTFTASTAGATDVTVNDQPTGGSSGSGGGSGIGAFDSATGTWYLRNETSAGAPDAGQFAYGLPNWTGVVGDWNGDGTTTVGVVNPLGVFATWYLRNENSPGGPDETGGVPFAFGFGNWIPLAGDWTGSGHTGIGMFDPNTNTFYLENTPGSGKVDFQFQYGAPGWIPVFGDWNHSGHTGIGMVDPTTMTWYLRNEVGPGAPDAGKFAYGAPGWRPVTGDWNGDGKTTVGLFDPRTSTWYLRNENNAGAPNAGMFPYGFTSWYPVGGVWTTPPAAKSFPVAASASPGPATPDDLLQAILLGHSGERRSSLHETAS
jgi:hypothetical protein